MHFTGCSDCNRAISENSQAARITRTELEIDSLHD
jgi:hypothetical protein